MLALLGGYRSLNAQRVWLPQIASVVFGPSRSEKKDKKKAHPSVGKDCTLFDSSLALDTEIDS